MALHSFGYNLIKFLVHQRLELKLPLIHFILWATFVWIALLSKSLDHGEIFKHFILYLHIFRII